VFEMPMPGLIVVRYPEARDMEPERQGALVEAIRNASRIRPVAVVFVTGEAVRSLDLAVPKFWKRVAEDPTIQIGAMAMVSGSLTVEIAARGVAAASRLRRHRHRSRFEVRAFGDERSAASWASQTLFAPMP
jgi:uroporphyrinogen-III synthase